MIIFSTVSFAADTDIRLNSFGFLPLKEKKASILESASATSFDVWDADSSTVAYTGALTGPVSNPDSGESLYTADFTSLTTPGTYYIHVTGIGRSYDFDIAWDVYDFDYYTAMRGFYLIRASTPVYSEHGGDIFQHLGGHTADSDEYYATDPRTHGYRSGTGGWYDAGDYGRYVVNAGITVGMLFMAWEHFSDKIDMVDLDIPESGGIYPDFLAEIKYEIDWLFKMAYSDGSGKISWKLTTYNHAAFEMPHLDTATTYFVEWGSAATADFVAMMAMASRIFEPYDVTYASQCLDAARLSYACLTTNAAHSPDQSDFYTGPYSTSDPDDRLWAAAEMWETTGEAVFLSDFESRAGSYGDKTEETFDWGSVRNLGMITYLLSSRSGKNSTIENDIQNDLLGDANNILSKRNNHGYGRGMGTNYWWGANGHTARQALLLQVANMVSPNNDYVEAALDTVGYLAGRNMHCRSYVTGLGIDPPMYPHDRRSAADAVAAPWPGYVVGGPNSARQDPVLTQTPSGYPPASYWADQTASYGSNEIAINWQAALIYALAGFLYDGPTPTYTATPTNTPYAGTPTSTHTITPTATITPTVPYVANIVYDGDTPGYALADGVASSNETGTSNPSASISEIADGTPGNGMQLVYVSPAYWQGHQWALSETHDITTKTHLEFEIKATSGTVSNFVVIPDWGKNEPWAHVEDYVSGGIDTTWKTAKIPLDMLVRPFVVNLTYLVFVNNSSSDYTVVIDNIRLSDEYGRTPTYTPSITMTPTITPTHSVSPTGTPTFTITETHTITPTHTITETHTVSPTITVTLSVTVTYTVTNTYTITPTITVTPFSPEEDLELLYLYPSLVTDSNDVITFRNLTAHTIIQIFNLHGDVVYKDEQDTPDGTLEVYINDRRRDKMLAPGVYIYVIDASPFRKTGKFAIIR